MTESLKLALDRINRAVRDKIRAVYSVEDEIQLLRTAPSPEFEVYNAYVEGCIEWGRKQKSSLINKRDDTENVHG